MRFLKKFLEMLGGVGGIPLKYGPQRGFISSTVAVQMAASQTLTNAGGAFVTMDASGYAALTSALNTASVFGWVDGAAQTTSATAGGTVLPCNVSRDTVYRLPVVNAATCGTTATLWRATIGAKKDLFVEGGIQGVAMDHATTGHVIIVAQDPWVSAVAGSTQAALTTATGCRWVDVIINPAIQTK